MPVELDETGPAITNAEIDAFEARIGRALPADYRAFLLKYNGGEPDYDHLIRKNQTVFRRETRRSATDVGAISECWSGFLRFA